MNSKKITLTQLNKFLFAVFLVSLILYLGRLFLIPVAIATLLSMLLFPVAKKFEQLKLKKPMAALGSILILLIVLGILSALVYYQISELESDLPKLEEKIEEKTSSLQWIFYKKTDISKNEQEEVLEEKKSDIITAITEFLKDLLVQGLYMLLVFFIVLAYTFFFLVYRHKIQNFLIMLNLFDNHDHHREARVILSRVSGVAHHYLTGVLIVISIMAVIYFLGFWAIGIEHALLFAIITALLRLVPYVGPFAGIALVIIFTFLTMDWIWYPVLVLAFFMVTQLIEAYLLTPNITGPKVKINPMITIMAILLGNLIWGIPGMILFVPLFGILKVFFDQIPKLTPFGYMLGKEEE